MDKTPTACHCHRVAVPTRTALLLTLPLSAAGMLLAHELTWGVASHGHENDVAHGYLRYGAVFVALAAAVVVVASTRHFVRTIGGEVAEVPSAITFAVMPIVGFVFQEHLEHLVAARELELTFFVSPPFVVGLALQLPFALAAMLVVRLIVRAIRTAVTTLGRVGSPRLGLLFVDLSVPARSVAVGGPARSRGLAFSSAGRAPPVLA
jgi:hypothetical protein